MSSKVSALPLLTDPNGRDRILVIDIPPNGGTPTSKAITLNLLLSNIPANTVINATLAVAGNTTFNGSYNEFNGTSKFVTLNAESLTVQSNGIVVTNQLTPSDSFGNGISEGKIFFDNNFLYIKTANSVVKRVALSTF